MTSKTHKSLKLHYPLQQVGQKQEKHNSIKKESNLFNSQSNSSSRVTKSNHPLQPSYFSLLTTLKNERGAPLSNTANQFRKLQIFIKSSLIFPLCLKPNHGIHGKRGPQPYLQMKWWNSNCQAVASGQWVCVCPFQRGKNRAAGAARVPRMRATRSSSRCFPGAERPAERGDVTGFGGPEALPTAQRKRPRSHLYPTPLTTHTVAEIPPYTQGEKRGLSQILPLSRTHTRTSWARSPGGEEAWVLRGEQHPNLPNPGATEPSLPLPLLRIRERNRPTWNSREGKE